MRYYYFFILYLVVFTFFGCENSGSKQVNLNLYLAENIATEGDKILPKVIIDLLEPLDCPVGSNAIINLTIYRYDFEPTIVEVLEIPLDKVNSTRKKFKMLSFTHVARAFKDNSNSFPNNPIFYKEPAVRTTNVKKKEYDILTQSIPTLICCTEDESARGLSVKDFNSLLIQLKDSICVSDNVDYNIIYKSSIKNETSSSIQEVFTFIGDSKVDPELRLSSIEKYVDLFADNAYVRVMGANGTLFEPEPISDYLQKIALYRSLEKIEVKEARENENGKYWEIHLKEFHQNITE